jgi:acetolactate synthase-1/2/3 large subunit
MYSVFLERCDVVLCVGSSLTKTSFGPAMPRGKTIIHSTNDVSDVNKDYRAAQALVGDARLVLEALIVEVQRQQKERPARRLAELKDEIATIKQAWLREWAHQLDSEEEPLNQYRVIRDLMKTVDRDNVIITHDAGSPREQLLPFWETTKAGSYMGWGKSTQLGYGLGITLGAKLAAPEKLCINVMGDSSFGMSGMDIETAARNGIGILTVVFNNSVMACERGVLQESTARYNALSVGGNYSKVAEGLNVESRRVSKPAEIVPAIKAAIEATSSGRPFLLEAVVKEGYEFSRYSDR